mgnify:FL=1
MSAIFNGFTGGMEKIPSQFFEEVLPTITTVHEMKVTLFAFHLFNQFEGDQRYILRTDYTDLPVFMDGLSSDRTQADHLLDDGLEKAVQRGTLLRVQYADIFLYFLNSPKGRTAVQRLQSGQWQPDAFLHMSGTVNLFRPNIYQLYEENIGVLSPMIAEKLRDAEQVYTEGWICDAIEVAVVNNALSWRYIETVLKSWKENGRNERFR